MSNQDDLMRSGVTFRSEMQVKHDAQQAGRKKTSAVDFDLKVLMGTIAIVVGIGTSAWVYEEDVENVG